MEPWWEKNILAWQRVKTTHTTFSPYKFSTKKRKNATNRISLDKLINKFREKTPEDAQLDVLLDVLITRKLKNSNRHGLITMYFSRPRSGTARMKSFGQFSWRNGVTFLSAINVTTPSNSLRTFSTHPFPSHPLPPPPPPLKVSLSSCLDTKVLTLSEAFLENCAVLCVLCPWRTPSKSLPVVTLFATLAYSDFWGEFHVAL